MDDHVLPGEHERLAWRSFDLMQQCAMSGGAGFRVRGRGCGVRPGFQGVQGLDGMSLNVGFQPGVMRRCWPFRA
jgi:hypothetical protein